MEKHYSLRQAAPLMGVKVRTLRAWVVSGRVNAKKYSSGNRWYIAESEVKRVMEMDDNDNAG